jgi:BlaI family transcriptional regulator, penicillinase repressor
VLWERGESKPAEIEAEFSWPIDNGTLRSVLRVLMDKGLVARRKAGKAYVYEATKSRAGVMSRMARNMAHVFSGGSTAGLIAQLIKTEQLSPEDLAELRRIARSEAKEPRGRQRKK